MKNFAAGFSSHIQEDVTQIATICKITLAAGKLAANGNSVLGFTDHDKDLTVSSVLYEASTGYFRSAIQSDDSMAVDNMDSDWVLDADGINADDLRDEIFHGATYELRFVKWSDVTVFSTVYKRGWIGEIQLSDAGANLSLLGLHYKARQTFGRIYSKNCPYDLGDSRCGKDITSLTKTGTVATVTSNRQFTITWNGGDPADPNLYDLGVCTFTSGQNDDRAKEIKNCGPAGAIELYLSMRRTVTVGDTVQIKPGCPKTRAACNDTFDNVVNFGGFPLLSHDAAFQYGKLGL